jgi:hypothetical protein
MMRDMVTWFRNATPPGKTAALKTPMVDLQRPAFGRVLNQQAQTLSPRRNAL